MHNGLTFKSNGQRTKKKEGEGEGRRRMNFILWLAVVLPFSYLYTPSCRRRWTNNSKIVWRCSPSNCHVKERRSIASFRSLFVRHWHLTFVTIGHWSFFSSSFSLSTHQKISTVTIWLSMMACCLCAKYFLLFFNLIIWVSYWIYFPRNLFDLIDWLYIFFDWIIKSYFLL